MMSNDNPRNVEPLMNAIFLSSSKTKLAIDQLTTELCRLAVSRKHLPVEEQWKEYPWACHLLQEVLHLHAYLQGIIRDCLANLRIYLHGQWNADRLPDSHNFYNCSQTIVINTYSDATAGKLPRASIEEIESGHHGHVIDRDSAENICEDLLARDQSIDEEQQQNDASEINFYPFILSLVQKNWDLLNNPKFYKHKEFLLQYVMSAVMWPETMQCKLDLPQKILRNGSNGGYCPQPCITRHQSTASFHGLQSPVAISPSPTKPIVQDQHSASLQSPSCLHIPPSVHAPFSFSAQSFLHFVLQQPYMPSPQRHPFLQTLYFLDSSPPSVPALTVPSNSPQLPSDVCPILAEDSEQALPSLPNLTAPSPSQILSSPKLPPLPAQPRPHPTPPDLLSLLTQLCLLSPPPPALSPLPAYPHPHAVSSDLPFIIRLSPHSTPVALPTSPTQAYLLAPPPPDLCPPRTQWYPHASPLQDMPRLPTQPCPYTPPPQDLPPSPFQPYSHTSRQDLLPLPTRPYPHTSQDLPPLPTESYPHSPPPPQDLPSLPTEPYPHSPPPPPQDLPSLPTQLCPQGPPPQDLPPLPTQFCPQGPPPPQDLPPLPTEPYPHIPPPQDLPPLPTQFYPHAPPPRPPPLQDLPPFPTQPYAHAPLNLPRLHIQPYSYAPPPPQDLPSLPTQPCLHIPPPPQSLASLPTQSYPQAPPGPPRFHTQPCSHVLPPPNRLEMSAQPYPHAFPTPDLPRLHAYSCVYSHPPHLPRFHAQLCPHALPPPDLHPLPTQPSLHAHCLPDLPLLHTHPCPHGFFPYQSPFSEQSSPGPLHFPSLPQLPTHPFFQDFPLPKHSHTCPRDFPYLPLPTDQSCLGPLPFPTLSLIRDFPPTDQHQFPVYPISEAQHSALEFSPILTEISSEVPSREQSPVSLFSPSSSEDIFPVLAETFPQALPSSSTFPSPFPPVQPDPQPTGLIKSLQLCQLPTQSPKKQRSKRQGKRQRQKKQRSRQGRQPHTPFANCLQDAFVSSGLYLQQAQPLLSSLSLPPVQPQDKAITPNPELPSPSVQPPLPHPISPLPSSSHLHLPAVEEKHLVDSKQKHESNIMETKIPPLAKRHSIDINNIEDSYIPFVTRSQSSTSSQDFHNTEMRNSHVFLPDHKDDSVTTVGCNTRVPLTEISTEPDTKNCEEKRTSGTDCQNDHTSSLSALKLRDMHIPTTGQDESKTIQCFTESHEEDYDDDVPEDEVIPVGALPMIKLPLPLILPEEHVEEALVSYVQNPGYFYLIFGRQGTSVVKRISEDLEEIHKDDDEPLKVWELPLQSCWAAKWSDGCWYRVKILSNIAPQREKEGWQVRVVLVDSGQEGVIPTRNIRVLQDPFALLPCQALPCHLAEVYPLSVWESDPWPASTTQAFKDMCWGCRSPLRAYVLSCCQSGTYGVILECDDGEVVNLSMVHQGLATSKLLVDILNQIEGGKNLPFHLQGITEKQESEAEIPIDWDPMSEAFKNSQITAFMDDECAETMLVGRRNTDGERQCRYHLAGRQCPRGEACPWEHTPVRDDITVEKEKALVESLLPSALPTQGSLLAARVTSVVSPSHFYIHLPFGAKNITTLGNEDSGSESKLEVFLLAMQNYYSEKSHLMLKNLSLPAPGELMVLLEPGSETLDCSRVMVLEVDDCRENACQVKIYFIDFGYEEWVKQEMLRPLAPQFAHLPPHAVECWLSGVRAPVNGWSSEATQIFKKMVEDHTLVAHLMEIDNDFQRVGVVLINMEESHKCNINDAFVSSGYNGGVELDM